MDAKENELNTAVVSEGKQYIVVKLGTEQYGIDIQYVDNIVRMQNITRVPKAQSYFKGVINLRGEIIPVMSLRLKFGIDPDEITNATRIIIIKLEAQATIGIIVDEVKEVVNLTEDEIDKPSYNENDEKAAYVFGVGKHAGGLISLMNIAGVIVEKEKEECIRLRGERMPEQKTFDELNDLNSMRYDILREVGNIGAGNATTALSQLMNSKIDMTVPKVELLDFPALAEVVGSAEQLVVGILLNLSEDIEGMMMFMMEQTAARHVVNKLMGKELSNDAAFDEMELSALKEIGNIIAGAYLSSLSSLTKLSITESVPYMAIDMAGAILSVPAIAFGALGDKALLIESEFNQAEYSVNGFFILIPTEESYGRILTSLGI